MVERWNVAAVRFNEAQAELSRHAGPDDELKLREQTARAEFEAVRREVARLKVEFNSGKRY